MKNSFKFTFNTVFLAALILLIAVNIFDVATGDVSLMKTTMPLFIPVFLTLFFIKYSYLGIAFMSFLLFSFLGDISFVLFPEEILMEASSVLHTLSFFYLILMIAPNLEFFKVDKIIAAYLLFVFGISLYFLFTICSLLSEIIPNRTEVLLYGMKSFALIVLTFVSFGVYLYTQTKQSILFFIAVVFFGMSVMLNYVIVYYSYSWVLELLQGILYGVALFVVFKYVMNNAAVKEPRSIELKRNYFSDTIWS
ncbi:hypothetical protein [Mariniflexile sp. AS56]|uniref:hypothetical protein n=1 Tax=Mariniflexile sp. AS56 TaxID=3063957 RepID=UPI0026EB55D1|nr:hypothetical protein [Mariniflexile sp. AS56]MDO7172845.1 hypothetical protein [Mariniflexile sp. AS56]